MGFLGHGTPAAPKISRYADISARWLIAIYSITTIMTAFSWLVSPLRQGRGFAWWEIITYILNIPSSHTPASTITMLVITSALITRKRIALYAVIFFQLLNIPYGIILKVPFFISVQPQVYFPAIDKISLAASVIAIPFLFSIRGAFPARIGRVSWILAATVFIGGVGATTLITWYFGRHLPGVTVINLLEQGLGIEPVPELKGNSPGAFIASIASTCYGLCAAGAVYLVLHGYRIPNTWTPESELGLRQLLQKHGAADSLSYFATRRDKHIVFSPDRRAAITYRTVGSVCLASSDPIGENASWGGAIEEWLRQVRAYGWIPAALSASEAGARAYAKAGLSIIRMGDEAILSVERFSLNNTSLTEVRHAYKRVAKAGYTVRICRHRDLSAAQLKQVKSYVNAWRHGKIERGFSMALNRLADPSDGRCLLVSAHAPDGEMVGVLSFVPWGGTGISLDVMRRAKQAPNGIVEFMVASLMENAGTYGISRVSLNFAMFRHIYDNAQKFGASPWNRFASRSLGFLDRFLQLERLYRFNLKFAPGWQSRYMAFEPTLAFINTVFAAGVAEGFLPDISARKQKYEVHTLSAADLERVHEIEKQGAVEITSPKIRRSEQTRHRIRHAQLLRASGMDPWPLGVSCDYSVSALASLIGTPNAPDGEFTLSGRVRFIRSHGGVIFLTLKEETHTVQAIIERERVGADSLRLLKTAVDTGDILRLTGVVGRSRTGTASVIASGWLMAAKCLHPIPFDAFTDAEARLRRRSTDLIVNAGQLHNLRTRSAIISSIRRTLDADGFTEVETPILNTVHGGASARPFKTFINAYGAELTLRIAPELYLKRLVVGGMGAVYELGRDFRNEGADATHNPEFTVLEAYKPYSDYNDMRLLTERIIKNAAQKVFGAVSLPLGPKGTTTRELTDVSAPWPVVSVCAALSEAVGREISIATDFEILLGLAREHEIYVRDDMGPGAVIEELYSELVEAKTVFPTFYTDFPVETSPLAGAHRFREGLVERWDLVINGMEMGTAYSELADALVQRERLTEQSLKAAAGDIEAMQLDEDFLYALETGLPPTGGLGIGIDRLVMLLANTQIRGVLSFPFVKPYGQARFE